MLFVKMNEMKEDIMLEWNCVDLYTRVQGVTTHQQSPLPTIHHVVSSDRVAQGDQTTVVLHL